MSAVIGRRVSNQIEALGAIEFPKNDQVREAFDVGKAGGEFGKNFQRAFGLVFSAEASGDVPWLFVRTGDKADGT